MKRYLLLVFLLSVAVGVVAQDKLKFSVPVQTDVGAADFRVSRITFDVERSRIDVYLREIDPVTGEFKFDPALPPTAPGKEVRCFYEGAAAMALMTTMNHADFTTVSLYSRIMQQLIADKKIPNAIIQ